ncbi:helix-turn-helix domain-containing protein [Pelomicrobium methylotrophicum]|uniref:Helix-turn-helix domain-containing protein n=1 Tax=Pelomicrobium methylotrophicum TaxID=2602750 RepID=A0A5C7EVE8_9PROT|nr:helix-turn-helix domain-containing protein [Pelomicrobium methylotrophicum]
MTTLDLKQAAAFLRMHPKTVQERAKAGIIPGAKPGKCWVFLQADLEAYLRSLQCRSTASAGSGTSTSRAPTAAEIATLLALPTGRRRRNTMTASRPSTGVKRGSVTRLHPRGATRSGTGS